MAARDAERVWGVVVQGRVLGRCDAIARYGRRIYFEYTFAASA